MEIVNMAKLFFYLKLNFLHSQYMEGNLRGWSSGSYPHNISFWEVLLELFQLITNLMP